MSTNEFLESPVDFAFAAWHEDGRWVVNPLPLDLADNIDALIRELQHEAQNGGAICLMSINDECFIAIRVLGEDVRILVSDVVMATEWPIAAEALDRLGFPMPDADDDDQLAGDAGIFSDLGFSAMEMAALCDDMELFPDEQLEAIAHRLGFGSEFENFLDFSSR